MKNRRFSRGFTLIELLTVIGVILVLAGIAFVAFQHMTSASKADQTHTTLGSLQNMLAELDASTKLSTGMVAWIANDGVGTRTYVDTRTTPNYATWNLDFWRVPMRFTATGSAVPLVAPGSVREGSANRNDSVAVAYTTAVMAQMARVPAARTALQQFRNTFIPDWVTTTYAAGDVVKFQGANFVAKDTGAPIIAAPTGLPADPNWSAGPQSAPMLLDGWNNPLIFVPAAGLAVQISGQNYIVTSSGLVLAGGTIPSTARPFFASAGPDEDFSKGDDNIYSFSK